MNVLKQIKTFFYPASLIYTYKQPKELIIKKVHEILDSLNDTSSWFSDADTKGNFLDDNIFYLKVVYNTYRTIAEFAPTLIGEINEPQNGITQITTKAKADVGLYFPFFIFLIAGIVYFIQFIQTHSYEALFWSLVVLLLGFILPIGISNIRNASLNERYRMYIDKELSSL